MKIDNEPVIYTKVHGLRFGTYKNDIGISKVLRRPLLLRKWHREPDFMDLLVNSVGRGDVVFDLGGNIGYATTLLSKLVGGSGTVFAVEPSLSNFKLLEHNIVNNNIKNATVDRIAVSDKNGMIKLNLTAQSNMNSILNSNIGQNYEEVKTCTFDDYLATIGADPSFIKMDIEGAEVAVISGMKNFLKNSRACRILMELHPNQYSKENNFSESLDILEKSGFKIKNIISASGPFLPKITSQSYTPVKIYKDGYYSRGLYEDVSYEDLKTLINNDEPLNYKKNLRVQNLFSRNRSFKTTKCVRAALFYKGQ